jgi:uncharacterized membrane protein
MKRIPWLLVALLSLIIGFYPAIYFLMERTFGLLGSKSPELLDNLVWNTAFYGHIIFGGLALLSGWSQFSKKLRNNRTQLHRSLGKFYVLAVLISGLCGFFIAFYATGGIVAASGFLLLSVCWLYFTLKAYQYAIGKDFSRHEYFMYLSFAACFAAVTLRIWLPLLMYAIGDFNTAYRIVAWLCWLPNVLVALILLRRKGFELHLA